MKQLLAYCLSIILCVSFTGCMENYLDLYPEDKITSASFPENESDIKLLLNGVYAQLREKEVYNQGLFGFGITDGATPNAFNWGTDEVFNKLCLMARSVFSMRMSRKSTSFTFGLAIQRFSTFADRQAPQRFLY